MWVTILLVAFAVCGLEAEHLCLEGDTPEWYPLFDIRSNDNQLPHSINSWADVYPGDMNIKYRGNHYERFRISVNGYVALLDDFNQPIPPIWPNQGNIQARDMINLFYAGTDITEWCGDVYWRISDDQTDIETFATWVKRASKFSEDGAVIWQPDTVMVVSYEEVDMVWDPCCDALYDKKRSTRDADSSEAEASASADAAARANGTEKRSFYHADDWQHGLNSYQMAIGSRNNGGGSTSTYVIFNYGHIGWVDWDIGQAWSQAGFTQKQKGSIYDSDYSFTWDMYSLGSSSGHPRKGVYVFQVDNWGPQCDPAPGWFIWDWNPTENNYWYSNPVC